MSVTTAIAKQFNDRVSFREAAPGIHQLIAPFFHPDGDMMEIYIEQSKSDDDHIRLTDFGMTLMRLSYANDVDSDSNQKYIMAIINEQKFEYENGAIFLDAPVSSAHSFITYFAQGLSKVMAINALCKDTIKSYFYDHFGNFVNSSLSGFDPIRNFVPVDNHSEYPVDYSICKPTARRPIYLFPVRDTYKAREVTMTLLFLQQNNINFQSVIVYENFTEIHEKDQRRIVNASDKAFYTFGDFEKSAIPYFDRELAG